MDQVVRIVEIVLPVVACLALGWMARVRGILSRAQMDGIKMFVVTFSLPAVLFGAFADIEYGAPGGSDGRSGVRRLHGDAVSGKAV